MLHRKRGFEKKSEQRKMVGMKKQIANKIEKMIEKTENKTQEKVEKKTEEETAKKTEEKVEEKTGYCHHLEHSSWNCSK